jgi:phenylacetate-coenzyme A ligase PaaK-like adenylate-forming protein
MNSLTELKDRIFSVSAESFEPLALEIFRYQAATNPIYAEFISHLHIKPAEVKKVAQIPFLPVELFKSHKILSAFTDAPLVFESSGTTGVATSRHYVAEPGLYEESLMRAFGQFFGPAEEYAFLALLPAYLERKDSSLTYMVDFLIRKGGNPASGFFLYDHKELAGRMKELRQQKQKIFFIGVSFALLDFAAEYPMDLSGEIIMETGGMKGRKKEIIREELHEELCKGFQTTSIASEYGMTELLSQAYALKNGEFETPPWMKVFIRELNDPFSFLPEGHSGGINVIDLANLNSCSFIALQDLGRELPGGKFEVLGRFDNADIRGCSLMYE